MQLAMDGWIYAVHESEGEASGADMDLNPVLLSEHGVVRFRRDGRGFQPFVQADGAIRGFRSLGNLQFEAKSISSEEGGSSSRLLSYGICPMTTVRYPYTVLLFTTF